MTEKRKQKLNLKVENDVSFTGLTEDSSPGDQLSVSSEELLQGGREGTRNIQKFLPQKPKNTYIVEHQKITVNNKNQTSQVHESKAFLSLQFESLDFL